LLDYLASALASGALPWSRQAVALAAASAGGAGVVGTKVRSTPGEAAVANAVLGHGLVRDDMHLGSVTHLGTVLFASLLATASTRDMDGKTLLTAAVAGYEAGGWLGRLILDVEVSKVFRPTGITGPFAAAAAAAKAVGLDAGRFEAALVFAANSAAGYNEWAATGGSEMFFHVGFAARNGLTAAALAESDGHASETGLDGPAGILAAFGKTSSKPPMPRGDLPEIEAVFFKEVPACNFAQTAAQVARDVANAHLIDIARVAHVQAYVPRAAALYPGCDRPGPFAQILQAKMSIHYNVATALATGGFAEESYVPGDNPEIVNLAKRVSVAIDPELTAAFPRAQGARVVVTLDDGSAVQAEADDVAPADDALVRERFEAAATAALGSARADELATLIDTIESRTDMRELDRLVTTHD
jgi:2-methylcitrate dehydratase PrpD